MNGVLSWQQISKQPHLSEDFMREHKDVLHWKTICSEQQLSEDFMDTFITYLDWNAVSKHQKLSEEFMEKHITLLNGHLISWKQTLSEDFISKHHHILEWNSLSHFQTLSEEFILKFQDKVNWDGISSKQALSMSFIKEHFLLLELSSLQTNKHISLSETFLQEMKTHYMKQLTPHIRFEMEKLQPTERKEVSLFFDPVIFPETKKYQHIKLHFKQTKDPVGTNYISFHAFAKQGSLPKYLPRIAAFFVSETEEWIFESLFVQFLVDQDMIYTALPTKNNLELHL